MSDKSNAQDWLSAMGIICKEKSEVVAVYSPNVEVLHSQAKWQLCILLFPPMFLLAPCFVNRVRRLTKLAPRIRHVVCQEGIGTFLVEKDNQDGSAGQHYHLDYNLVYNRIGFVRWKEILKVSVVQQNKSFSTVSFMLHEVQSVGGESSRTRNVTLDWVVENPTNVKKEVETLMMMGNNKQ